MKKDFDKTKRYKNFMNDNWADLLYGKYYKDLNSDQKKKVAKGIANDKKHNKKDAAKIKREK